MALWSNIEKKENTKHAPENKRKDGAEKQILAIIDAAFGIPDEIKREVIKAIDKSIKNGLENGGLDYGKVLEMACEGYEKEQIAEAYGHQLLGAYVAYTILTGKPLKLK